MSLFGPNKEDQLQSHLNNLIAVGLSDGTLDDAEWNRIVKIAGDHKVDKKTISAFRENAANVKFIPPVKFEDKVLQIFELVEIMIADGQIEDEEMMICRKLALKCDIHPRIVNDMLGRIPQLISEGKRASSIVEEIVKANS